MPPAAGEEIVDRIVAVVNDDIITLVALEKAFAPYKEQIVNRGLSPDDEMRAMFDTREKVLDQLIGEKLTDQEIQRLKLTVSENEIDEAIEHIKRINYLTDETLREALQRDGMSMADYRKEIKNQILRPRLINYEVKSKIIITNEDIEEYYKKHLEKYGGVAQYHLRTILITTNDRMTADEISDAKKRMEDVYNRLKQGTPFVELADEFSDPSLSSNGGNLGLFKIDDLSPLYRDAVSGLASGEFTPVLETPNGYQILYVDEIVQSSGKSLKDATEEISETLYNQVVNEKFNAWLEGLRKKSDIRIIN